MSPDDDRHTGPYGSAVRLPIADGPRSAQTVDHWLITAPQYHPLWSQYVLACVRLDDLPGWPPPIRRFVGATHELIVVALNPDHGPYGEDLADRFATGGMPYLTPVNIVEQYAAADAEMRRLCSLAAWGVVVGALNPETADAPDMIRRNWAESLAKTLAHLRGEEHEP